MTERDKVLEEAAVVLDGKAALYRAYQERAARSGDTQTEALMQGHANTVEDDARSVRALKRTP